MSINGSNPIPFLEDFFSFLSNVGKIIGKIKNVTNFYNTKSLADVTKLARVEPITVISKDLLNVEYLPEVLQSLLSMFTAYYLQAVALSARIDKVEIVRVLDSLNPDRDSSGWMYSSESLKDMPTLCAEEYQYRLPRLTRVAMESDDDPAVVTGMGATGKDMASLNEVSNLAVGKVFSVTIDTCTGEADNKFTIPISIRLVPAVLSNISISKIIALKSEDISLVERFHSWRSGRITFIKDLILCQDLIDEHRKALMNDESGTYNEIIRRVNSAKKYGLLTKNPSLVSASNIFVISDEVQHEVEAALGGKLSNVSIRNKAFESTYAMFIVLVDREWQRVTIYTRGINVSANYSIKDLKMANKGKGMDVADLLKAFTAGSAPTF